MCVAAALAVLAPAHVSAAPSNAQPAHTPYDVDTLLYRYAGGTVSASKLADLQTAGKALFVSLDGSSASKGFGYAFDSATEADARGAQVVAEERQAARQKSAGNVGVLSVAGCPSLSYGVRFYTDSGCGGSYLSMARVDSIQYFSTYGWNDRASSLAMQGSAYDCVLLARVFDNANYDTARGYLDFYSSGSANSWNLGSFNFNDRISSARTSCH